MEKLGKEFIEEMLEKGYFNKDNVWVLEDYIKEGKSREEIIDLALS